MNADLTDYLSSAIDFRRKFFMKNLKKTLKSPTCNNTHNLSTSLKRLLIVNGVIHNLYGVSLIPAGRCLR